MQGEDGVCRVQCDNSQCLSGVGIDFCLKFWCFLWFLVGVCVCVCWVCVDVWVCVCGCGCGCMWVFWLHVYLIIPGKCVHRCL